MSTNQEARQLQLAEQLAEAAHTLAHSIRDVPRPTDTGKVLAELAAAQRSLAATYSQLVAWHTDNVDADSVPEGAHDHLVVAQLHAHGADGALRAAHDVNNRASSEDASGGRSD
ncbi:hypothetical protein ACFSBZ_16880 [Amnibacterium flavum]|uniref:Uncharacterized protein n=1 Tax=Amnibacterium flavum TaxID=2173173 RepID=A0A2V1HL94_9MICO|nr:hypothetical protein [Amnibacterium flavum]PVZ93171.1 hypothetical protein DDQ50_16745 [Amnibacterium flavum]